MKNSTKNNIGLLVAAAIIVGSIAYLQAHKPTPLAINAKDVVVEIPAPVTPLAKSVVEARKASLPSKVGKYPKAKEFVAPSGFINTPPFKLSDVVGKKVVLIDFWTYSCINCLRTTPYLNAWYSKYKDKGLVIIGVHTPEFDFEKDYNNVLSATKKIGVTYPVILDNDRSTWTAYNNQYWPREYLIDIDGYIVHDHIGEGDYDKTERAIQEALKERATVLGVPDTIPTTISNPNDVITMNQSQVGSPETYFGGGRNEYLGNGSKKTNGLQTLAATDAPQLNTLYLNGAWNFSTEYAENKDTNGKIFYKFNSKNVYFVASSLNNVKVKIILDGRPIDKSMAGSDVDASGILNIKENRLYDIVHGADYGTHTLEMDIEGQGLDAYTFTFG